MEDNFNEDIIKRSKKWLSKKTEKVKLKKEE